MLFRGAKLGQDQMFVGQNRKEIDGKGGGWGQNNSKIGENSTTAKKLPKFVDPPLFLTLRHICLSMFQIGCQNLLVKLPDPICLSYSISDWLIFTHYYFAFLN